MKTAARLFYQQKAAFESENINKQLPAETTWYNEAMEHRDSVVTIAHEKELTVAGCCQSEPLKSALAKMIEKLTNCETRLLKFLERKKATNPDYQFMPLHELVEVLAKKTE